MGLWGKLFGGRKKNKRSGDDSPYLPKTKDKVEILFAKNFTKKGGKFIYSEDAQSTDEFFKLILEENQWKLQDILCFDTLLNQRFGLEQPIGDFDLEKFKVFLIGCEYLIANKGNILICHHQLKDYKLENLPDYFIVFSGLNNFANDVSEGMSKLKNKYADHLPSNITTLNVRNSDDENDFLSYGNSAKNLYLVLQEH